MNSSPSITNFGRNITYHPQQILCPESEAELLEIVRNNPGKSFRVFGSLHAWSRAAETDGIALDFSRLNKIEINDDDTATVQAGARIKNILSALDQEDLTLPSIGLIKEQAIAGATATGTHGSGKNSLSHYIQTARVLKLDESGNPIIREINEGDELKAIRCSLGALGLVTSVTLPTRQQYNVLEHFIRYPKLNDALKAVEQYPIQQIFFVPWLWEFFAQRRVETERPRSSLAWLYRTYWAIVVDRLMHLCVIQLANRLPQSGNRFFWRWIIPIIFPQNWKVVDQSVTQLTMGHELYRHIEIEIFVKESHTTEATNFVKTLLRHYAGEHVEFDSEIREKLEEAGIWSDIQQQFDSYRHHYPICIRRILPDETFLSPSAGSDEPVQAMSFACYQHPERRESFFAFADVLARSMALLFSGRPHWGKYCPLDREILKSLYPEFETFRKIANEFDPYGVFGNAWTNKLLSDEASEQVASE